MLVSHLGHLEVVHGSEEQRKFKGTWDPKESHPKLKYSPWGWLYKKSALALLKPLNYSLLIASKTLHNSYT